MEPPIGWRSKIWLTPTFCCIVCNVELVVNVGELIINWYWLVYAELSTMFISSFITLPFTFNDELIVVTLFNVVFPETFNDELIDVASFHVVEPETFKVYTNVMLQPHINK